MPLKLGSKQPKLERDINLFEAVIYGIGIILGAGIYALVGKVYGITGHATWITFLIAAIIALMTGLSYAELSSSFPKSAAEYTYVKEAFPEKEAFHFTVGWVLIFSSLISTATVALGFGGYFVGFMGAANTATAIIIVAIVLISLLTFVNFIGIEESAKLNIIFTIIEAAGIVFIIIIGFINLGNAGGVDFFQFPSYTSNIPIAIMTAASLIFFAYIGFEDIANIAEETEKPEKTIPRALILSIIITTILYILVALSISAFPMGTGPGTLGGSENPFAFIVSSILSSDLAIILITIVALFATANTVLIMLIVSSRMMYGMSNAGALPKAFSKIHKRTHTPWVAIIFTTVFSIGFLFLGEIGLVARASVFSVLLIFFIINVVLIYLRKSQPDLDRPFKVKPSIKWVPIIPLLGAITTLFLLITFADFTTWDYWFILIIQLIIIAIGIGLFYLYRFYKKRKGISDFNF
ncbi:MAG: APC family permease [Candidatus Helarchaeota archaeon]